MKIIERIKDYLLGKFWYHYPNTLKHTTKETVQSFKELVIHIHNIEDKCSLRVTQDIRGNYQIWMLAEKKTKLGTYVKDAKIVALYNVRLERMKYSLEFLREISKQNYVFGN